MTGNMCVLTKQLFVFNIIFKCRHLHSFTNKNFYITTPIFYVNAYYENWDDPNDLIDRLSWLVASKRVGTTFHNEEIKIILKELEDEGILRRVNDKEIFLKSLAPHMGHLYSAVVADAVHRVKKLLGAEDTRFSTGTDEHGIKIQQAAAKHGIDVQKYCTNISEQYRLLFEQYNVDFTDYIRTTEDRHCDAVKHFWKSLENSGNIYSGTYSGWYSVQDETFLSENQLMEIKDKQGKTVKVSAESRHPVEWTEEKNYIFKLSSYTDDLLHWLKGQRIWPIKFQNILLNWINEGFAVRDISVSRPTSRVNWGIPVPGDSDQTVYVWLDALINYLTVIGYPDSSFQKYWPCDVHVVGKDILKFHGIYWPAFLIAVGLEPPQSLICHSHWTVDGEKMSKSLGNVVSPVDASKKFTADAFRYFLLREGTMHSDANYSEQKVTNLVNAELADTLGNMLNRCCGKIVNKKQVFPKFSEEFLEFYNKQEDAKNLFDSLSVLPDTVKQHFIEYNFYKGVDEIIATLRYANKYFEVHKPWELVKDENQSELLNSVLHLAMETLRVSGILLQPIIPHMSSILLNKLAIPSNRRQWSDIRPFSWETGNIYSSQSTSISSDQLILYKRLR